MVHGFAHVEAFQQGRFVGVLLDEAGQALQHAAPGPWRLACPASVVEGGAGRCDGGVDVAGGDGRQRAAVARGDAVEAGTGAGGAVVAVDE